MCLIGTLIINLLGIHMYLKKIRFLSLLALVVSHIYSQSIEIKDIDIIDFDSKNVGVITKDSKKIAYTFYLSNQVKGKGEKQGELCFFDSNLNQINKVILNFSKNEMKFRVKDNGKNVMLYYYDRKNNKNVYKIFAITGELIYTKEVPFERKGGWLFNLEANNEDVPVCSVPNKGFLIYHYAKKTKMGYNFYYIDEDNKKEWTYSSPLNCPDYKDASVVAVNEKMVVLFDREFSSLFEKKTKKNLIVLNAQSGEELFELESDYQSNPSYYTNAVITSNNQLVVLSEYYDVKNKFFEHKNFNNGYLIEKFDSKGNKVAEKKLDFKDQLFADKINFKLDENGEINSNLFFHDCYEIGGKFYFVSEKVERINVNNNRNFALVHGIFVPYRVNSTTEYSFQDYYTFEFNEDLSDYNVFRSEKKPQEGFAVSYVRRPLLNMFEMKYKNDLSYISSTIDKQNKFSFQFIEKEIKDKEVVLYLKRMEDNQGVLSTNVLSKIEVGEQNLYRFRILPFEGDKALIVKSIGVLKLSLN